MKLVVLSLLISFQIIKGQTQVLEQSKKIAIDNHRQIDGRPKLIVCYYANWKNKTIAGNPCTHIIYAFVAVHNDGSFPDIDQNQKGKVPIVILLNKYICRPTIVPSHYHDITTKYIIHDSNY